MHLYSNPRAELEALPKLLVRAASARRPHERPAARQPRLRVAVSGWKVAAPGGDMDAEASAGVALSVSGQADHVGSSGEVLDLG